MWRIGTPMKISHDIHPHHDPDRIIGVPPVWHDPSDFSTYLVDDAGVYLFDDSGDFLVDE